MQISVVIPTFNRAGWVEHAIRSVLSQTAPPLELIVVDDGSTDGTRELVASFVGVRCIRQRNRGPSAARNAGAAVAKGDWLAFLDSDDRWLPDKLTRQSAWLRDNPGFRICYTDEIWIRRGRRVNQKKKHAKSGGWIYPDCLPLCRISPSSVLIERGLWQESGGFDESFPACEDYDLWLRIAAEHPIGFIEEPLIEKYGGHGDQLSGQRGLDRYRVAALEKMLARPLRPEWRRLTAAELVRRCRVLDAGYAKHGNPKLAGKYRTLGALWSRKLQHDSMESLHSA